MKIYQNASNFVSNNTQSLVKGNFISFFNKRISTLVIVVFGLIAASYVAYRYKRAQEKNKFQANNGPAAKDTSQVKIVNNVITPANSGEKDPVKSDKNTKKDPGQQAALAKFEQAAAKEKEEAAKTKATNEAAAKEAAAKKKEKGNDPKSNDEKPVVKPLIIEEGENALNAANDSTKIQNNEKENETEVGAGDKAPAADQIAPEENPGEKAEIEKDNDVGTPDQGNIDDETPAQPTPNDKNQTEKSKEPTAAEISAANKQMKAEKAALAKAKIDAEKKKKHDELLANQAAAKKAAAENEAAKAAAAAIAQENAANNQKLANAYLEAQKAKAQKNNPKPNEGKTLVIPPLKKDGAKALNSTENDQAPVQIDNNEKEKATDTETGEPTPASQTAAKPPKVQKGPTAAEMTAFNKKWAADKKAKTQALLLAQQKQKQKELLAKTAEENATADKEVAPKAVPEANNPKNASQIKDLGKAVKEANAKKAQAKIEAAAKAKAEAEEIAKAEEEAKKKAQVEADAKKAANEEAAAKAKAANLAFQEEVAAENKVKAEIDS